MDMAILEKGSRKVREHFSDAEPICAVILGSGQGAVTDGMHIHDRMPYADISSIGSPSVEGHCGELLLAECGSGTALVFSGRRHYYEGIRWEAIAAPVHIAKTMGATSILISCAAGGISDAVQPGEIMLLEDHINLMGDNPLRGPHDPFWGPRFPDQSAVYDSDLRDHLARLAGARGEPVRTGVYLAVSGPAYETPAEITAFGRMGADAVGMSTIPEAILANSAGLKTVAAAGIVNYAASPGFTLSHNEVVLASKHVCPKLALLIKDFFTIAGGESNEQ